MLIIYNISGFIGYGNVIGFILGQCSFGSLVGNVASVNAQRTYATASLCLFGGWGVVSAAWRRLHIASVANKYFNLLQAFI